MSLRYASPQAETTECFIKDKEAEPGRFLSGLGSWTINGEPSLWHCSVRRHPNPIALRVKTTEEFTLLFGNHGFERSPHLKLDRIDAAALLRDLSALPGNRFEALVEDRNRRYSIRINDQCRICFEWADQTPGPSNVEIVDY
jgi:proteic killer suppression protein